MGWLRLVGSLKLWVSSAEYHLFHRALLQKRPMILRSLLVITTPYLRALTAGAITKTREKREKSGISRRRDYFSFMNSELVIEAQIWTFILHTLLATGRLSRNPRVMLTVLAGIP